MGVSSSERERQFAPTVFLRAPFMEWTRRSHKPPNQGESGAINLQSGPKRPNCLWEGLATKSLALSDYRTRGGPLLAANLRIAHKVSSVGKAGTNSRWNAGMTPQVNSIIQKFLPGESQVYTGLAWSRPVTANGVAWLTLTLGRGPIDCPQATLSCLWHGIQSFLACLAIRVTPSIQNVFIRAEIMTETLPCFMRTGWNLVNNKAKCDFGRMTGCFSSQNKDECCNRPWTRRRPSSATKGVNTIELPLGTEQPCLTAASSVAYLCSWTHWINWCLAAWSSWKVKSPTTRSSFVFVMSHTKRMQPMQLHDWPWLGNSIFPLRTLAQMIVM